MAETKIDGAVRADAAELDGLVAVQPGAIVSRTLVEGEAGTVTLFGFDIGQALSEHTAPYDAMVQVLEGRMEITVGGIASDVSEGCVIVMPAHVPHSLKATVATRMLLVMIRAPQTQ